MKIKLRVEYSSQLVLYEEGTTRKGKGRYRCEDGSIMYNGLDNTIIEEKKVEWTNNKKSTKNLFESLMDYIRKGFPHGYLFTEEITWGVSESFKVQNPLNGALRAYKRIQHIIQNREHLTKPNYIMD